MSRGQGRKPRPPSQPLEGNYIVTSSGCWQWTGRADGNGNRVDWAHRISYRKHKGKIPHRYEIDHTCQNTLCVNPAHLDAVTKVEHARRTMARLGYENLQREAANLRVLGLTYREIGDALGLTGQARAHERVMSAIKKGLVDPDSLPPVRHLSDADHRDMASLYALGISQGEIGAFYEVDASHVSRVVNGKRGNLRRAS